MLNRLVLRLRDNVHYLIRTYALEAIEGGEVGGNYPPSPPGPAAHWSNCVIPINIECG